MGQFVLKMWVSDSVVKLSSVSNIYSVIVTTRWGFPFHILFVTFLLYREGRRQRQWNELFILPSLRLWSTCTQHLKHLVYSRYLDLWNAKITFTNLPSTNKRRKIWCYVKSRMLLDLVMKTSADLSNHFVWTFKLLF